MMRTLLTSAVPMKRLQRADRALGDPAFRLLRPLLGACRRRPAGAARRVLLIKFWGLGSLQLMTPAVRALRRRHPGASLELLTLRPNGAFARGLGVFDRVLTVDLGSGWAVLVARILGSLIRLRGRDYDVAYDFEFFTRFSAIVSVLSGAPETHGFVADGIHRDRLHTDCVPYRRDWHVARNFRALAGEDRGEVSAAELTPYPVRSGDRAEAAAVLFAHGADARPLVVLDPNAGSLSLERRWPAERFAALARRLVLEDGVRVALIGTAAERARGRAVTAGLHGLPPESCLDLTGELSVGSLAALLEGAAAFVTNDSGPMHVAAALGTPTVALFGPETPTMYRPLGARVRVLYRPPACSPCINVHENKLAVCIRGRAECMTSITVAEVLAATREELRRTCASCS